MLSGSAAGTLFRCAGENEKSDSVLPVDDDDTTLSQDDSGVDISVQLTHTVSTTLLITHVLKPGQCILAS